jgi:probable phosphoglycerate mutase
VGDLQCAARVFVARHGEAVYESELLSDHGGWLSPLGREQAKALATALASERIARVWCSPMARAVQTAEIVAGVLGVDVVVREGLREFGVGDHAGGTGDPDPFRDTFSAWLAGDLDARVPGAESGAEVVARVGGVLEEVADTHRGEAVLVISHGGAICTTVPSLAANLSASHGWDRPLANCDVVALEADADGWVARSWAGEPLGP